MKRTFLLLVFSYVLTLAGCAQQEKIPAQPDYDQTKKMVVDILAARYLKQKLKTSSSKQRRRCKGRRKKLMRKSQAKSKQHEGLNRPSSQFRNDFPCNIHIHFSDRMIFSIY